MAGLYTNIVTSKNKTFPLFPRADTSIGVYSTMSQQYSAYHYYPAFSGGTAGRAIRINHSSNLSTASLLMYNADGTAVSDGVWNGGLTVDEASTYGETCLLYTSPSPRDLSTSRMPSSA